MIYKVGQRVRIVKAEVRREWVGREATITRVHINTPVWTANGADIETLPIGYRLAIDGVGERHSDGTWIVAQSHQIAPLTDPLAEQFIQSVKSWGPLEKEDLPAEDLERVSGGMYLFKANRVYKL